MKKITSTIFGCAMATLLALSACAPTAHSSSSSGTLGDMSSSSNDDEGQQESFVPEYELTNVLLCDEGKTDYTIVIPENATPAIENAAKELKNYFAKATGATLPIEGDNNKSAEFSQKVISLGETKFFTASKIKPDTKALNRDGFIIERKDNTVIICAARDLGVLYGVYEFLSIEVDFEAYASSEVYVYSEDTVYLQDISLTKAPDFAGRVTDGPLQFDPYGAILLGYADWSASEIYDYGDSGTFIPGHSETYAQFIPRSKYNNESDPDNYHPEWFAQSSIQFCLTNTELQDELVKNAIAMLEENYELGEGRRARYLNISQNDGGGWCTCATCKPERDQYTDSGYVIRFTNKIVERLEEWRLDNHPEWDLKYCQFAYNPITPPVKKVGDTYEPVDPSVVAHKRLSIRMATLQNCYNHSLKHDSCTANETHEAYFLGWSAISTEPMTVYDYSANYHNYLLFLDIFNIMQTNLQFYKELGINHVYTQNATGLQTKPFGALENYLRGKLMWDVDADVDELTDNFFKHYYKSSAEYVRKYFDHMRTYIAYADFQKEGGWHFKLYDTFSPDLNKAYSWPIRVLEQGQEYLEQAKIDAQKNGDSAVNDTVAYRVLCERACSRYILLRNYTEYYSVDKEVYLGLLQEWEDECLACNINCMKEKITQGGGILDFISSLRAKVQ